MAVRGLDERDHRLDLRVGRHGQTDQGGVAVAGDESRDAVEVGLDVAHPGKGAQAGFDPPDGAVNGGCAGTAARGGKHDDLAARPASLRGERAVKQPRGTDRVGRPDRTGRGGESVESGPHERERDDDRDQPAGDRSARVRSRGTRQSSCDTRSTVWHRVPRHLDFTVRIQRPYTLYIYIVYALSKLMSSPWPQNRNTSARS